MDQTTSVKLYRAVLMTSIVMNMAVGVLIAIWPDAFTNQIGQPEAFPDTWPRHWGRQLLAINALYLPWLLGSGRASMAQLVRDRHPPSLCVVLFSAAVTDPRRWGGTTTCRGSRRLRPTLRVVKHAPRRATVSV